MLARPGGWTLHQCSSTPLGFPCHFLVHSVNSQTAHIKPNITIKLKLNKLHQKEIIAENGPEKVPTERTVAASLGSAADFSQ